MKYFMPASHLIQIIENEKAYPKIDLNSAGRQELESVPYIGKTLAGRILYYRKKKGPFHSKEELRNVKGISGKVYNKIEKYLRVRK
jgi:competence protein ComEA